MLVPYTKEKLKTFLESHFDDEEVKQDIDKLRSKVALAFYYDIKLFIKRIKHTINGTTC